MIKVELHTHTAEDPADAIPHSTPDLIDRAARLGYGAVAVTLHDKQLDLGPFEAYARVRKVVLIPGIERTIHGKHVLLLNFPAVAEDIRSFEEVAALKRRHPNGLVVAPHPFFPASSCLGTLMERHAALFDAVELNYFFTRQIDFNGMARRFARAHGKPLVGNADAHRLYQLGRTYSLVDALPNPDAICAAVREGRVEAHTEPITLIEAAAYFGDLWIAQVVRSVRQLVPASEPAGA